MSPSVTVVRDIYRTDIDGLRALAISAVVAYHVKPQILPGGFTGVDIFFVISGYLISSQILKGLSEKNFSLVTFYLHRIRRIFPALILVLVVTWLLGWFFLFPNEYVHLSKYILSATQFITNFTLLHDIGYFDVGVEAKPLLHLWSLAIEEQFYIFFPILMLLGWRIGINLFLLAIFGSILSFCICLYVVNTNTATAFYHPITRLWELLVGAALATCPTSIKTYLEKFSNGASRIAIYNFIGSVGFILVILSFILIDSHDRFPGWQTLMPVFGSLLLIISGPSAWPSQLFFSRKGLVILGLISYPLYLWHWPLLSFLHIVNGTKVTDFQLVAVVIIALGLSWLTWRLCEIPVRHIFARFNRFMIAAALIFFLAVIGFTGQATITYGGFERHMSSQETVLADVSDFEGYREKLKSCREWRNPGGTFSWCSISQLGIPSIALFGDSHADQYFPGIQETDFTNTWLLIGQSSCPPLIGVRSFLRGNSDACVERNAAAMELILSSPEIKVVVLASLGPYYIERSGFAAQHHGESDASFWQLQSIIPGELDSSKRDVFVTGLSRTIKMLLAAGKKVVVVADIPEIPFLPTECIGRPYASKVQYPCSIERHLVDQRQKRYRDALIEVLKYYPEVVLFDPLEILCNQVSCNILDNSGSLYRDSHHLSLRGSRLLAPKLLEAVVLTKAM